MARRPSLEAAGTLPLGRLRRCAVRPRRGDHAHRGDPRACVGRPVRRLRLHAGRLPGLHRRQASIRRRAGVPRLARRGAPRRTHRRRTRRRHRVRTRQPQERTVQRDPRARRHRRVPRLAAHPRPARAARRRTPPSCRRRRTPRSVLEAVRADGPVRRGRRRHRRRRRAVCLASRHPTPTSSVPNCSASTRLDRSSSRTPSRAWPPGPPDRSPS